MAKQANNDNADTEVTLTTTADVQAPKTAPQTLLGYMEVMISEAEANGDYTRAGILQNLAVRVGELKLHASVAADVLDGAAAELVGQLRDGL